MCIRDRKATSLRVGVRNNIIKFIDLSVSMLIGWAADAFFCLNHYSIWTAIIKIKWERILIIFNVTSVHLYNLMSGYILGHLIIIRPPPIPSIDCIHCALCIFGRSSGGELPHSITCFQIEEKSLESLIVIPRNFTPRDRLTFLFGWSSASVDSLWIY